MAHRQSRAAAARSIRARALATRAKGKIDLIDARGAPAHECSCTAWGAKAPHQQAVRPPGTATRGADGPQLSKGLVLMGLWEFSIIVVD